VNKNSSPERGEQSIKSVISKNCSLNCLSSWTKFVTSWLWNVRFRKLLNLFLCELWWKLILSILLCVIGLLFVLFCFVWIVTEWCFFYYACASCCWINCCHMFTLWRNQRRLVVHYRVTPVFSIVHYLVQPVFS